MGDTWTTKTKLPAFPECYRRPRSREYATGKLRQTSPVHFIAHPLPLLLISVAGRVNAAVTQRSALPKLPLHEKKTLGGEKSHISPTQAPGQTFETSKTQPNLKSEIRKGWQLITVHTTKTAFKLILGSIPTHSVGPFGGKENNK